MQSHEIQWCGRQQGLAPCMQLMRSLNKTTSYAGTTGNRSARLWLSMACHKRVMRWLAGAHAIGWIQQGAQCIPTAANHALEQALHEDGKAIAGTCCSCHDCTAALRYPSPLHGRRCCLRQPHRTRYACCHIVSVKCTAHSSSSTHILKTNTSTTMWEASSAPMHHAYSTL